MKKLIYIVIILLALSSVPLAKQYLCMTRWNPGKIRFYDIPGPGSHPDGLTAVRVIDIPSSLRGLTFDGDNFWLCKDSTVYCFDIEGNPVKEFPNPYPDTRDLGYDGEYIWMNGNGHVNQIDTDGDPGPYGGFDASRDGGIAINPKDEAIFISDSGDEGASGYIYNVNLYDYEGNLLPGGYWNVYPYRYYVYPRSIAFDGSIVWMDYVLEYSEEGTYFDYWYLLEGYTYVSGSNWDRYSTVDLGSWENCGSIAICDHDFINIAEESLGRIKAYFAEEK